MLTLFQVLQDLNKLHYNEKQHTDLHVSTLTSGLQHCQ